MIRREPLGDERACRFLVYALCAVYFAGYFARLDYAVVIAEIVRSEGLLKSDAALATTACFATYGAGQLVSGWLGDRVSPRRLIFGGLAASAVCNGLIPLCSGVGGMVAVWAVNGLAQSMLWPPMMRLMTGYLPPPWVEKGCVDTLVASSSATVLLYLAAPLVLRLGSWRRLFVLAAALSGAVALGWLLSMGRFERLHGAPAAWRREAESAPGGAGLSMTALLTEGGLLFAMFAIVMQGTLRDGVTTWLPSYLTEVFRLPTGSSILSSVIIPLFSIVSVRISVAVKRKFFGGGEIRCSRFLFRLGAVLSLLMAALFTTSAACSAALAAALTGCMHGVNMMLICNLPARFAATGKVSLISGVLNACTYIGSALSTYVFALAAQSLGWRATVVCWAGVCILGAAACTLGGPRCRRMLAGLAEDAE